MTLHQELLGTFVIFWNSPLYSHECLYEEENVQICCGALLWLGRHPVHPAHMWWCDVMHEQPVMVWCQGVMSLWETTPSGESSEWNKMLQRCMMGKKGQDNAFLHTLTNFAPMCIHPRCNVRSWCHSAAGRADPSLKKVCLINAVAAVCFWVMISCTMFDAHLFYVMSGEKKYTLTPKSQLLASKT